MTISPIKFKTTLLQTGKTTTGILVPPEIIKHLSAGGRPAVVARIGQYSYRTTIGVMGGKSLLPFSAQNRSVSGLAGGQEIEVELALDSQPRTVEIPIDLSRALDANPLHTALFSKQAPSRQKADVEAVTSAKTAETRERRIAAIIAKLGA